MIHNGLRLHTRHGCHQCDAFIEEMQQFNATLLNQVSLIDVDENTSHAQQFGDKVPILFAEDVEICRYFFDVDKIKSCLKLSGDSLE